MGHELPHRVVWPAHGGAARAVARETNSGRALRRRRSCYSVVRFVTPSCRASQQTSGISRLRRARPRRSLVCVRTRWASTRGMQCSSSPAARSAQHRTTRFDAAVGGARARLWGRPSARSPIGASTASWGRRVRGTLARAWRWRAASLLACRARAGCCGGAGIARCAVCSAANPSRGETPRHVGRLNDASTEMLDGRTVTALFYSVASYRSSRTRQLRERWTTGAGTVTNRHLVGPQHQKPLRARPLTADHIGGPVRPDAVRSVPSSSPTERLQQPCFDPSAGFFSRRCSAHRFPWP
jgi:hypothetical protein